MEKDSGVDNNRNFPKFWQAMSTLCEETYGGENPFSEPETKAVKEYLDELRSNIQIVAALDVHSYGPLIVLPDDDPEEETNYEKEEILSVGQAMADSISQFDDEVIYEVGLPMDTVGYRAGGTAVDYWFYNLGD